MPGSLTGAATGIAEKVLNKNDQSLTGETAAAKPSSLYSSDGISPPAEDAAFLVNKINKKNVCSQFNGFNSSS